jgi:hypothetical protein
MILSPNELGPSNNTFSEDTVELSPGYICYNYRCPTMRIVKIELLLVMKLVQEMEGG